MEAIALRLEAIALRLEAIAIRLVRLEAIASREAVASNLGNSNAGTTRHQVFSAPSAP